MLPSELDVLMMSTWEFGEFMLIAWLFGWVMSRGFYGIGEAFYRWLGS